MRPVDAYPLSISIACRLATEVHRRMLQDKFVLEKHADQNCAVPAGALQQEVRESKVRALHHIVDIDGVETAPADGFSNVEVS